MPLVEKQLFEIVDKVAKAIDRLRYFEPEDGYYLAFSGGKDSVAIKHLADMAGVKYDAHYNVTTIDPPEVVRFIRDVHPDVAFDHPDMTFFQWMHKKLFPPTRIIRWCCEKLKERGGDDRTVVTGVRWAESIRRKQRGMVERCYNHPRKLFLHGIIEWTDEDVWEFIRSENIPYCDLYDQGMKRIGCLMCPLSGPKGQKADMERYPKFANAFRHNFRLLYENRMRAGKPLTNWKDGDEWFEWWIGNYKLEKDEGNERFPWFE